MKTLSVFAVMAILVFSMSCVLAVVDTSRPDRPSISLGQMNKTLPLKAGGSILLENTAGDIRIEGWDEDSVDLVVEEKMGPPASMKMFFFGQRRSKPDIQIQSGEEEIRIRTPRSAKEKQGHLFDYHLKVPRAVNFREIRNGWGDIQISDIYGSARISGEAGAIQVRNFSGPLEVDLERGNIGAELLDLRPQDEIVIRVGDGDITLFLESALNAELEAEAPEGGVTSELGASGPPPGKTFSVIVGEGGTKISLAARRGRIQILRIEE